MEVVGWISSRGDLYALGFGLVSLGLGTGLGARLGASPDRAADEAGAGTGDSSTVATLGLLGAALTAR